MISWNLLKNLPKNTKLAFLHGKAFRKMKRGDYLEAAKILEEMCGDNNEYDNMEYYCFLLGRCYFELAKNETALSWLSKSCELYQNKLSVNSNAKSKKAYQNLISVYSIVLRHVGKSEIADKLVAEFDGGK